MSWTRFAWLEKVEGGGVGVTEGKEERKPAVSVHVKMVDRLYLYQRDPATTRCFIKASHSPIHADTPSHARCSLAPLKAI